MVETTDRLFDKIQRGFGEICMTEQLKREGLAALQRSAFPQDLPVALHSGQEVRTTVEP